MTWDLGTWHNSPGGQVLTPGKVNLKAGPP